MINLALISHSPHLFGSERSLLTVAELFHNQTSHINPILMIPILDEGEMSKVANEQDFKIIVTPQNPWYIYRSPNKTDDFAEFCITINEQIRIFQELLKKTNTHVVLVNTLTNFIPVIAAYKLGLPVITWIRGVLSPKNISEIDPLYQTVVDKELINLSDKVIYNSRWTEEYFEQFVSNEKSVLIKNWTPVPEIIIPYDKSSKNFICLNSLEQTKGIEILVDACKKMKNKGYEFTLELYGIGPDYTKITNQINENNLNGVVSIKSRTRDIAKLYNECAALIQPSLYESYGRTTIEAMSYKRPVIAATTADPENNIRNGITGFRVEAGNSDQLAEKMIYILENRDIAESMGIKGYKLFQANLNGKAEKKRLSILISELYKEQCKFTPEKQIAYDVLNLIHKRSFD